MSVRGLPEERRTARGVFGGVIFMTKDEASRLENRCDKIMSGYLGKSCTVSMALTGKLKIEFDDGDYITWNMTVNAVDYVSYTGFHSDLLDIIMKVKECIDENRDIFVSLLWSYNHRTELEE
jgi:hypothetical protein